VTSSKPSQTLRCEALRGTDLWHLLRYSSSLLGVWGLAPKKERGVSGGLPLNLGREWLLGLRRPVKSTKKFTPALAWHPTIFTSTW
jgi:hypothetical protein